MFTGFDWYKKLGSFLVAEPEKALVDCLYMSGYKSKRYTHFPEMHFSKSFSIRKVKEWIRIIPNSKVRMYAEKRLETLLS